MNSLQEVQSRFSTNTHNFVYGVDTVFRYTDEDFEALTNFSYFLRDINGKVDITNISAADAQSRLANPHENITNLNYNSTYNDWKTDTIQLLYSLSTDPTLKDARLGNLIVQSVEGINTTKVASSNEQANQYMLNIMSAIGRWKYTDMKQKLLASVGSLSGDVQRALTRIGELSGDNEIAVLAEIRSACIAVMEQVVKDKDPSNFLMTGLVEGPAFNMTYIRFYLRESIYKRLFLKNIKEDSDAVLQYMKRILAELFVVCYYPLVHYLYASEMQKYFIARGDFMNMRGATAAKVFIVINSVKTIIDAQNKNTGMTFTSTPSLQEIVQILNVYFKRLSNPVFDDPNIKFGDIDIDMRNLSKVVNTQSMSIDDLKKHIQQNQLFIRSHAEIYKGVDGSLRSKQTQFSLFVIFIIALIIVAFVMLKFEFYPDYLIYGLLGVIVFFLLVIMIQNIVALSG